MFLPLTFWLILFWKTATWNPFLSPSSYSSSYQADMVNTAGQQSMNTLRMHVKCITGNYGWWRLAATGCCTCLSWTSSQWKVEKKQKEKLLKCVCSPLCSPMLWYQMHWNINYRKSLEQGDRTLPVLIHSHTVVSKSCSEVGNSLSACHIWTLVL